MKQNILSDFVATVKTILSVAVLCWLMLFSACSGDNLDAEIISTDLLSAGTVVDVSGDASTDNAISVDANCTWRVTSDASWIKIVKPNAGMGSGSQNLTFDVEASSLSTGRTGHLTITTSGNVKRIVTVTQRAGNIRLQASSVSLYESYTGGDQIVEVSSNSQWTATSSVSWITINNQQSVTMDGDQSLAIHLNTNNNPEGMGGTITITDVDHKVEPVTINVEIGGRTPTLVVTPANDVEAMGGISTFAVESNFTWTASIDEWQPASTTQWALFAGNEPIISGSANSGGQQVTVEIDPNPTLTERTVRIVVRTTSDMGSNNKTSQLTIHQAAATLPVVYTPSTTSVGMNEVSLAFVTTSTTFPVSECGILYSTDESAVRSGVRVAGELNGQDAVTTLSNLQSGTTYYACAYSLNAVGTIVYSNVISFRTRLTPGRDGNPVP